MPTLNFGHWIAAVTLTVPSDGSASAAEVVSSWMRSPGHRDNILSSEFTEIGTGVALGRNGRLYWAQVFGRPLRSAPSKRMAE